MAEKTEQPTPKKLRDARKKGQVASSKEVVSTVMFLTVFSFLLATGDFYLRKLKELMDLPTRYYGVDFHFALEEAVNGTFLLMVQMVAPLLALVVVMAIVAHATQFGILFALESVKPDLKKLNPAQGVKKLFSIKNLIELAKSILKILFLSILLYLVIRAALPDLAKIPDCGVRCIPSVLGVMLEQIVFNAAFVFVVVAAADYVFQRFQHTKKLRMTKDEVKREYKESEGDPLIKGKRKQFHQELMNASVERAVKRSSVVVTNPTHIAVALEYRDGETPLPIVRAKGMNLHAKHIIAIAKREGIPIMQNVPLAHALHEQAELDQYIPSDLIEAVAEVLKWVQDLEERKGQGLL